MPKDERVSISRASKGERGLWQRRYLTPFAGPQLTVVFPISVMIVRGHSCFLNDEDVNIGVVFEHWLNTIKYTDRVLVVDKGHRKHMFRDAVIFDTKHSGGLSWI